MASFLEARKARGLTIQDIAEVTGMSVSQVWRWEQGMAFPPVKKLRAVAQAYGVGREWLIDQAIFWHQRTAYATLDERKKRIKTALKPRKKE